jgi:hypothetical protein
MWTGAVTWIKPTDIGEFNATIRASGDGFPWERTGAWCRSYDRECLDRLAFV